MTFNRLAQHLIESHSVSVSSQNEHGVITFFKDNKLHREDGPAVIYPDGTEIWWYEGETHREDGPAVIWEGDPNNIAYYLFNKEVTKQEHDDYRAKKRKQRLQQTLQTKDNNMFDAGFIEEM